MSNSKSYSKGCFYGKGCFGCEEVIDYFVVVSTGTGMNSEMLSELGRRRLAISCPFQKDYFVLDLTKEQVRKLTQGKLEEINKESAKSGLITNRMIMDYLIKNKDEIKTYTSSPCRMLPPDP